MMKKLFLLKTILVLALGVAALQPAAAQSPGAARANQAAFELYMAGDYEQAAEAYAQLLKDYPTDLIVPAATVQLAFCYYFLAEFDRAEETIRRALDDPTLPTELKPVAMSFLPQILSSRAAALDSDDPERKKIFEQAIEAYGAYLKEFPKGEQVEQVVYGRALAYYQIQDYDAAVADLEENLQNFPRSPTVLESQNLLALALATQGSLELAKGDAADQAAGFALFRRAIDYLQDIIDRRTDLTLVNDAQFQLAEILYNKAAFSPEEERPAIYEQAMAAYRSVAPNEEMIDLQEEKLAGFPARRQQLVLRRDTAGIRALDRELEREQRRLGEMRGKPDPIPVAMQKMGEIYFNLGDYNSSRVVLSHVRPFLEEENDIKRTQYFLTLGYALQNVADRAVENYNAFNEEFKGDPIAGNLPFVLGSMFLSHPDPGVMNPETAIAYFDESLEIYPEGQFAGLSVVSKASAETMLGKLEEAEATFREFLAGSPSPAEAVVAQKGLADVYKGAQRWDDSIAAYQKVIDDFPDTPQAEESVFWIAIGHQQKGDNATAIPLLRQFVDDNPDSIFAPSGLYALASAHLGAADDEASIETARELVEKHPDSDPAPFAYFLKAQIYASRQQPEEITRLMREFIEGYPMHQNVYYAYDSIAQNAVNTGDLATALEAYQEYVNQYPTEAKAPEALYKASDLARRMGEAMGRYTALTPDERNDWEGHMEMSVQLGEQMVQNYPDSDELALGLASLLQTQRLLLAAELKSADEVESYFEQLAEGAASAGARSKILFSLAAYVAENDEARALSLMDEAFDPEVLYAPADLDFYGLELIDEGRMEQAAAVFDKLASDYPNPAGVEPQAAPPNIQEAQAIAMFGRARIAQESGETAQAAELFERLKQLYPWSPKVIEAEFGIAEAEVAAGQLDQAQARLPAIIRNPNATSELRAKAMFLLAVILEKRSELAAAGSEQRREALAGAIDNYIKIAQFYPGAATIAAEGLWRGGQLLEQQAAAAGDEQFRQRQRGEARRAYEDLLEQYPNSRFADQARERLNALGAT